MSGDSISRKAVIDEMYDLIGATERLEQQIVDVLERVSSEMPSAEPKTGKWIHDGCDHPHGVDWMHCSECGKRDVFCPNTMTNFCPNCGAKMEVEDAETNF